MSNLTPEYVIRNPEKYNGIRDPHVPKEALESMQLLTKDTTEFEANADNDPAAAMRNRLRRRKLGKEYKMNPQLT